MVKQPTVFYLSINQAIQPFQHGQWLTNQNKHSTTLEKTGKANMPRIACQKMVYYTTSGDFYQSIISKMQHTGIHNLSNVSSVGGKRLIAEKGNSGWAGKAGKEDKGRKDAIIEDISTVPSACQPSQIASRTCSSTCP